MKTLTDPDTLFLSMNPIATSIAALSRPPKVSVELRSPRFPFERDVVRVRCKITAMKRESDGDLHLVLEDRNGYTMIAEVPDPERCSDVARSGHAPEYLDAIRWCRENLGEPRTAIRYYSEPAIVTGVVFQDSSHRQFGASRNGRELHPILKIESSRNHTANDTVTLGTQ